MLLTPALRNSFRRKHRDNSRPRPKRSTCCWFRTEKLVLPVQQNMILERLLHRIASCSLRRWRRQHVPKSPLRLHSTSDRNCTTSFQQETQSFDGSLENQTFTCLFNVPIRITRVPSLKVMERFGRAAFLSGTTYGCGHSLARFLEA